MFDPHSCLKFPFFLEINDEKGVVLHNYKTISNILGSLVCQNKWPLTLHLKFYVVIIQDPACIKMSNNEVFNNWLCLHTALRRLW